MDRARRIALFTLAALSISVLLVGSAFGLDHRLARWVTVPDAPHLAPSPLPPTPTPAPVLATPPHGSSGSGSGGAHVALRPPDDATLVTMPDVVGLRVGAARRQLRALGLRVRAADADGYTIEPDMGPYYHVDSASVPAGTRVARGTVVRLLGSNPNEDLGEGY